MALRIQEGYEATVTLANSTIADEDILVIPRGCKHPKEAFEFIKFVQSQHGMEELCLGQKKFSPLVKVSKDFFRKHPNPYVKLFDELGPPGFLGDGRVMGERLASRGMTFLGTFLGFANQSGEVAAIPPGATGICANDPAAPGKEPVLGIFNVRPGRNS